MDARRSRTYTRAGAGPLCLSDRTGINPPSVDGSCFNGPMSEDTPSTAAMVLDELADLAGVVGASLGGTPQVVARIAQLVFSSAGHVVRIVDAAELEQILHSRRLGQAAGLAAYHASARANPRHCLACGATLFICEEGRRKFYQHQPGAVLPPHMTVGRCCPQCLHA